MKTGLCAIAAGLIAGAMMLPSAHAQYATPVGSIAPTMPPGPVSDYSAYVHNPTPAQVTAAWGEPGSDKSGYSAYIHNPTPAQVNAAWGQPGGDKSYYSPYIK